MNVNVGGKLLQGRIGKIRDIAAKGVVWRSPLCKSSIQSVFPGLFTDKINFFQVKMYSGLFLTDCHVQPNVWKDCKGKYYFSSSFRRPTVLLFLTLF